MPGGPIDCNEVLKLWPAEPIRTIRANTCGIQAYLFRRELECRASLCLCGGRLFVCVENCNTEGGDQTDAKSANGTTDSNSQARAVYS